MDDSDLLTRFSARLNGGQKPTEPPPPDGDEEETTAAGNAYATLAGPRRPPVLEFIRRNDDAFALPYHSLSVYWWRKPGLLLLEYGGIFTVGLHGRQIAGLYRRIKDQRVTWIRECSEAEAATLPLAVTSIEILHAFPSREAAGGNSAGQP